MGEGPRARNVRINFRWRVAASGGGWRVKDGSLRKKRKSDDWLGLLRMPEANFPVPGLPLSASYPATWIPRLPPATRNDYLPWICCRRASS
jgi:hypothetical protein